MQRKIHILFHILHMDRFCSFTFRASHFTCDRPRIPRGISQQERRAIHQLRLNRLTSSAARRYQAFIGQIPSSICPHCVSAEETAEHRLIFCPKWSAERLQYFGDFINISDVFQDADNLVEFFISLGHLPLPHIFST